MSHELTHIIVVEDSKMLRDEIVEFLHRDDWLARGVDSGAALDAALQEQPADIVVLDLNLPGEDGIAIAQRLRTHSNIGIIMLTARTAPDDRALGYGTGADIYLTKPAHMGELESAIENLLSRLKPRPQADLILHKASLQLHTPGGRSALLSATECRILTALQAAPDRQLASEDLLALMLPEDDNSVDVMDKQERHRLAAGMNRLRTKLKNELQLDDVIQAVHGVGYRLKKSVDVR